MLESLTLETCAPLLGQGFLLHPGVGAAPRELSLLEASSLGNPRPGVREPFSLIFVDATPQSVLPQQIYLLEHAALGKLELFLVPIGPGASGMQYQAIFS